jgi:hypothetical protein
MLHKSLKKYFVTIALWINKKVFKKLKKHQNRQNFIQSVLRLVFEL